MIGAEASGYFLLGRSSDHRVDLVSGYTYNKLKDSMSLVASVQDNFTGNLVPDGNHFHLERFVRSREQFPRCSPRYAQLSCAQANHFVDFGKG